MRDFLDEDELQEYDGAVLQTKSEYDTFGSIAKEKLSRDLHEKTSSGASLFVPEIMVTPVAEGVGVRLLLLMGWRQGKGLDHKDAGEIRQLIRGAKTLKDIEHVIEKGMRISNTRVEQIEPKLNTFGLGYDPFKGAEEFRHAGKKSLPGGEAHVKTRRPKGIAFGTGALEDPDDIGIIEDYVSHEETSHLFAGGLDSSGRPLGRHQGLKKERLGDRLALAGYSFEIEDDFDTSSRPQPLLQGSEPMMMLSHAPTEEAEGRSRLIPEFIPVQEDILPAIYPRPRIKHDYKPKAPSYVREKSSLLSAWGQQTLEKPTNVPEDPLKNHIDQVALQVARSGPEFEKVAISVDSDRTKEYCFISPGDQFHKYYVWKVQWYYRMIHPDLGKTHTHQSSRLNSETRGAILGEKKLEKVFPNKDQNYLTYISEEDRERIQKRMAGTFVSSVTNHQGDKIHPGLLKIKKDSSAQPDEPQSHKKIVTVFDLSKPLAGASIMPKEKLTDAHNAATSDMPIRRIDAWIPDPLLCKRLEIKNPHATHRPGDEQKKRDEGTPFNSSTSIIAEHNESAEDAMEAAQNFLDSLIQEGKEMSRDTAGEDVIPISKPTNLFQVIFEEPEDIGDQVHQQNPDVLNQFKPVVLPDTLENSKRSDESPYINKSTPDPMLRREEREKRSSDMQAGPPVDDDRIREALRIVEEAKRKRKKEKEKRKKSRDREASKERSSRRKRSHRHSREQRHS